MIESSCVYFNYCLANANVGRTIHYLAFDLKNALPSENSDVMLWLACRHRAPLINCDHEI